MTSIRTLASCELPVLLGGEGGGGGCKSIEIETH